MANKVCLRSPASHLSVSQQGSCPGDACQAVLTDILSRMEPANRFEIGLIAMNMKVRHIVFVLCSFCVFMINIY